MKRPEYQAQYNNQLLKNTIFSYQPEDGAMNEGYYNTQRTRVRGLHLNPVTVAIWKKLHHALAK